MDDSDDDDDGEELPRLVERAKRRDAAAFAKLIRRCERAALAIAYAHLGDAHQAGDVVQEAFLKAWQRLGDLAEPDRFPAWLCGIVRHAAIDLRRRVRPAEDAAGPWADPRPASDPAGELDRAERRQQIAAALDGLDEITRSAVVLRYYEDLSSRAIAELLGLTPAAVDMRLCRARQELRDRLAATVT